MAMVAGCFYDHGKRVRELGLADDVPEPSNRSAFAWIGLLDPDAGELEILRARYGLPLRTIEAALDPNQPPKLSVVGNQLLVVARTAHLDGDHIRYGNTAILVGQNHIVTLRRGSVRSHAPLREELETATSLLARGVDHVLQAILDFIVDGYAPIFQMIQDDVHTMERRSLETFFGRDELARIFGLRCELARFQHTLGPMSELVHKLARGHYPCIDAEARPHFDDVFDHVARVRTMNDTLLQVLVSMFEFSSLLEQQRTGTITRQLAAWAAILAVPTAVAGIYGMNFGYMPELEFRYGYFVVLGVVTALCVLLYVRFRRLKWL
jgi:magnesium transporter